MRNLSATTKIPDVVPEKRWNAIVAAFHLHSFAIHIHTLRCRIHNDSEHRCTNMDDRIWREREKYLFRVFSGEKKSEKNSNVKVSFFFYARACGFIVKVVYSFFFIFFFSLLTTVSIYIEVNLSLKRVNNVNSESKENWNISIQRSLRMVHGSRVEDIKIVERVKVSLYVTIRDTFHACECVYAWTREDVLWYLYVFYRSGNVWIWRARIEYCEYRDKKKKGGRRNIEREIRMYFQYIFPKYVLKWRKISQLIVNVNVISDHIER